MGESLRATLKAEGLDTRLMGGFFALTLILVGTSAQGDVSPFYENADAFVEEQPEQTTISRDCFQRSCYTAYGHTECRMKNIACENPAPSEWLLAAPNRLVAKKSLMKHAPGLIRIIQHKHAINPNGVVTMPGIPAKAPPGMKKAMHEQDANLKKVLAMEPKEATMDPMHKKARANWIHLAKSIQHMPPGPTKFKNEKLVLHLAKNLALREMMERKNLAKIMKNKKALEKKLLKVGGKKLLHKAESKALAHILGKAKQQPHAAAKTVDGIPVGHRKCYERACLRHFPNGTCAAVVVTCGNANGKKPAKASRMRISKAQALKKVQNSPLSKLMKGMAKGAGRNAMVEAGEQVYSDEAF